MIMWICWTANLCTTLVTQFKVKNPCILAMGTICKSLVAVNAFWEFRMMPDNIGECYRTAFSIPSGLIIWASLKLFRFPTNSSAKSGFSTTVNVNIEEGFWLSPLCARSLVLSSIQSMIILVLSNQWKNYCCSLSQTFGFLFPTNLLEKKFLPKFGCLPQTCVLKSWEGWWS